MRLAALLLLAASTTAPLAAQSGASSLGGPATDPAGGVVPGAAIEIENAATGLQREIRTDSSGRYGFAQLQPGEYDLTARQESFADVVIEGVEVRVNTPVTLQVVFAQLDTVAETVTVEASATQVNTTDASVGNAFGTKPILQLPLNARNVAAALR